MVEGVLQNAFDAMSDGGTLHISGDFNAKVIRLHIKDTGPGIAPEHQPHLFTTPFFTTKTDTSRLGFSLWLSRLYLQSVGGDIAITATSSAGTTLTISLPQAFEAHSNSQSTIAPIVEPQKVEENSCLLTSIKILLVEDQVNWQGRLALPLTEHGCEVVMARSYAEALRLLEQHTFAAFIIDVCLVEYDIRNADGLKLVQYIRDRGLAGPVLVLSGFETALEQARTRFTGWDQVDILDKMDDRMEETLLVLVNHGRAYEPASA